MAGIGLNYGGWDNMGNIPFGNNPQMSLLGDQSILGGGLQAPGSFGGGFDVPSFSLPDFGNTGGGGGILDSLRSSGFLGQNGQQGWGGLSLGAIGGLGSAYMGMRNYGLARDSLNQSQDQFNRNYAAQRSTLNTQLEDRQRARVAAGGGAESVDSYLARNRIQ